MRNKGVYYLVCAFAVFWAVILGAQVLDPVVNVCTADGMQGWPQVACNPVADEYLVVWEDYRNSATTGSDLWGQFVSADGTLRGDNFAICQVATDQFWPHLDYDPDLDRYLIVFEDYRNNQLGDIYGIFVGSDGSIIPVTNSEADGSFSICTNDGGIYAPSVAFNFRESVYLAVWEDHRNMTSDIYGQIVSAQGTLLGPPAPPDPTVNFAIENNIDFNEGVPDISYSSRTNEWFVVYGRGGVCQVLGRRVNALGQLVSREGTTDPSPPMTLSDATNLTPDGMQPRVHFNNEYVADFGKRVREDGSCECMVIWNTETGAGAGDDVYGQRVGFILEGLTYVAYLLDQQGSTSTFTRYNQAVSSAAGSQRASDIAYSTQDNEFLAGWGDGRDPNSTEHDLYCQRLWVNAENQLILLNGDRSGPVDPSTNIPVDATANYEGSLVGMAHSMARNEFFLVYTFEDVGQGLASDVLGRRIAGSPPTAIPVPMLQTPESFSLGHNYPNPFNAETVIPFQVKSPCRVILRVYDLMGREVLHVLDREYTAGSYRVSLNSSALTSGVYFYKIRMGEFSAVRKMVVLE